MREEREMKNEVKPFDKELFFVKALLFDYSKGIVTKGCYDYSYVTREHTVRDCVTETVHKINPYTICRNSGIKDNCGNYAFEYDLVEIINSFSGNTERYGYLEWSDFYKKWRIKTSFEYSTSLDVEHTRFEIIGNVQLSDEDMQVMIKQDEADSKRELIIDNSDCRPLHKRLKKKW